MISKLIKKIFIVAITCCFVYSCVQKESGNGKVLAEGKMVYSIKYLASEDTNPLISLLPNQLDMLFKNNNIIMTVEGWMGIFKSGFLRICKSEQTLTLLKVMNKKYYYHNIDNDNFMGVTSYTDLEFSFDDQIKKIIDFDCEHAVVSIPSQNVTFDVYYTKEIGLDNPNKGTPFYEIPGVLMEFQLEMNGIPMHIIASEFKKQQIPNTSFDIPEGYEEVGKEVVDELLESLMQ